MNARAFGLALLLCSTAVWAQAPGLPKTTQQALDDQKERSDSPPSKESPDVDTIATKVPDKTVMQAVFKNFTQLIPYMSNPEAFKDPLNETKILGHMASISQAFQVANHSKQLDGGGMRPSLETMQEHWRSTIQSFKNGHRPFALARLKAATTLCISCHSQLPKEKNVSFAVLSSTVGRRNFTSDLEYADYLFIMRNYDKAQRTYLQAVDQALDSSQKAKAKDKGAFQVLGPQTRPISEAIKQLLVITLKVQNSPDKARDRLQDIVGKKNLPEFLKKEIDGYLVQLETLRKSPMQEIRDEAGLDKFVADYLEKASANKAENAAELDLRLLAASGLLQHYLNKHHSSPDAPKIFYWLAMAERPQSQGLFYNLADVYLKECIRRAPKHPYAKKCYERYEDEVAFGYTGSSGTSIPEEDKKELDALKKLVNDEP